jgi:hypothetical protein
MEPVILLLSSRALVADPLEHSLCTSEPKAVEGTDEGSEDEVDEAECASGRSSAGLWLAIVSS